MLSHAENVDFRRVSGYYIIYFYADSEEPVMRKLICTIVALVICLSVTACSRDGRAVPAEQVQMIMDASFAEDRYAGMVVSEEVTKIFRDANMTISDVYVEEGDTVTSGQRLFSYDSDAIRLELDKQRLEMDKLNNEKSNNAQQLKDLKNTLSKTDDDVLKAQLKLQINTIENAQKQLQFDIKAQNKTIYQLETTMKNAVVSSPVAGTVRKITSSESAGDAYITIQKAGAYRIKGRLNEMSMNGGIVPGTPVEILSRLDDSQLWKGVVSSVDMENETGDSSAMGGFGGPVSDAMTTSSNYAFYVDLESTDGLLLGQHVYIRIALGADNGGMVSLPQPYFVNITTDEETFEMTALVYTVNEKNVLEARQVVLGEYDEKSNTYQVLSGLTADEYVANPNTSGCKEGAKARLLRTTDLTGAAATETSAAEDSVTEESVAETAATDTTATGDK